LIVAQLAEPLAEGPLAGRPSTRAASERDHPYESEAHATQATTSSRTLPAAVAPLFA
jgi:hypothetical protein